MSTENGFPPSQPTNYQPRIFIYPSGVSIPVFVEASSIRSRPKLVRLLRNAGALISFDPAHAHVILVDPNTNPGRQFIRDWGSDPIKVVLEYRWATKCIEAGRPLLQNDIWGDCIALDDGQAITKDDDDDEIFAPNPLPTPRPTPSDPESSSKHRDRSKSHRSKPDPPARTGNNDVQFNDFDPQASSAQSASRIPDNSQLQTFPQSQHVAQTSQPPPFPPSQQPQQPQQYSQAQSYPQYPQQFPQFPQSQQFPQQQQFSQSQPLANNQFTNPFPQGSAPPMQQFSQMQPGQGMPYSTPMLPNLMGPLNGYDPQTILATFMDVYMRQQQNMGNFQMPMGMPQQSPNSMAQQMLQPQNFQNNAMPPPGQEQSISSLFPNTSVDAANDFSDGVTSVAVRSPSPERCPPSIRRRSVLASTPSLSSTPSPKPVLKRSKGKGREVSPRRSSLKRMRSPSYEEPDVEIRATPPRYPTKTPQVESERKPGEIFKTHSGGSLQFFVQVDLTGRHAVVQIIKKNGGKMVGNISDANYVILGNALSKTYHDLLAQATAANKLPLRHGFISDCVKHGGLLQQDDYVLEDYAPPKKRGRPSLGAVKVEKKVEKPKVKKVKKTADPIHHNGLPSPSPPPSKDQVNFIGGNYWYTPEELDYFKRYARCLLERDIHTSNITIFKHMNTKMPHHSTSSWQNHITRNLPNELDNLRKKIGIANRKATDAKSSSRTQVPQNPTEAGPSKMPSREPTANDGDIQAMETTVLPQDVERQDFDDICKFFATGGGENSDDEQVWAALETHQHCRSASSWPDFFRSRQDDVVKEIDRLIQDSITSNGEGATDPHVNGSSVQADVSMSAN